MKNIFDSKKRVIVLVVVILLIVSLITILVLPKSSTNSKSNSSKGNNKSAVTDSKRFYLDEKYYGTGQIVLITSSAFESYQKDSYILFVSSLTDKLNVPCESVFEGFAKNNKIDILSMNSEEFEKLNLANNIKSRPTIIIADKGEIKAYLNIDKKEDLDKYQDEAKFKEWVNKYIYLEKNN